MNPRSCQEEAKSTKKCHNWQKRGPMIHVHDLVTGEACHARVCLDCVVGAGWGGVLADAARGYFFHGEAGLTPRSHRAHTHSRTRLRWRRSSAPCVTLFIPRA